MIKERGEKKGHLEPPKEYGRAYSRFYFGTPDSKKRRLRIIREAATFSPPPFTPQVQEFCENFFLRPLREGNHKHFRNIADTLGAKHKPEYDSVEHYVFMAFEEFRRQPILVGKWPALSDIRRRALRLWASVKLWGKDGHFPHTAVGRDQVKIVTAIDYLTEENEDLLQREVKKLQKRVTNWENVWKNTGLLWLKSGSKFMPNG
jgi:hypothetical protein